MSQRAWIGRGAAAAAASAALIMAFQPAAIAAPDWPSDRSVVKHSKYSKHWKQGNDWRHRARWTPPASETNRVPETNRAPETNPEPQAANPVNPAPADQGGIAGKIHELTNAERAKAGLPALKRNDCLTSTAQNWSNQMASEGRMYHSNLRTWMGKCALRSVGENVAYGGRSAEQTVQMWMNSSGHRENILSADYTELGVGWTDDGQYTTQAFGA